MGFVPPLGGYSPLPPVGTERTVIRFAWLPTKMSDGRWTWYRYFEETQILAKRPFNRFSLDNVEFHNEWVMLARHRTFTVPELLAYIETTSFDD